MPSEPPPESSALSIPKAAGYLLLYALAYIVLFLGLAVIGAYVATFLLEHVLNFEETCNQPGTPAIEWDFSAPSCTEGRSKFVMDMALFFGGAAGVGLAWLITRTETIKQILGKRKKDDRGSDH